MFSEAWSQGATSVILLRSWYRHKRSVSVEDLLRTARACLAGRNLLVLVQTVAPLRVPRRTHSPERYAWRARAA